ALLVLYWAQLGTLQNTVSTMPSRDISIQIPAIFIVFTHVVSI
ncbi:35814_t:CDS:1, partial [Racocetra persica]